MLTGLSRSSKNRIGLTLVELLLAILLLGLIFLAVSSLYITSQRFYFTTSERLILSAELQYAMKHIYNNAMRGIGDINSPAIQVPNIYTVNIDRNTNDPLTSGNYTDIVTYTYVRGDRDTLLPSATGNGLLYSTNGTTYESLIPKVTVTDIDITGAPVPGVNFATSGNTLTISITGAYKTQTLTLYSSCYPRLASFH